MADQKLLKFRDKRTGKIIQMPWGGSVPPTDKDIEDYVKKQPTEPVAPIDNSRIPAPANSSPTLLDRALTPLAPEVIMPEGLTEMQRLPGTIYNKLIRPISSPVGAAATGLLPVAGMMFPRVAGAALTGIGAASATQVPGTVSSMAKEGINADNATDLLGETLGVAGAIPGVKLLRGKAPVKPTPIPAPRPYKDTSNLVLQDLAKVNPAARAELQLRAKEMVTPPKVEPTTTNPTAPERLQNTTAQAGQTTEAPFDVNALPAPKPVGGVIPGAPKPKVKLGQAGLQSVTLMNATAENIRKAKESGYEPTGTNPDGSMQLQKVDQVGRPTTVPQLINADVVKNAAISKPEAPLAVTTEQRVLQTLKQANNLRAQQEELYSVERAARAAKGEDVAGRTEGEEGFHQELGQLKGELPKVEGINIRDQIPQEDITSLFETVKNSNVLRYYEKVRARQGLSKLLGAGGQVPQESEIALLNKVFGPSFVNGVRKSMPYKPKERDMLSEILNIPRSLKSSIDLSAPFRQGLLFAGKKEFWGSFKDMFYSAWDEEGFQTVQQAIKSDPSFGLAKKGKLALTDLGDINKREEAFQSSLAEKLPVVGRYIRGSGRAYTGFLNKLRFDVFKSLNQQYADMGIDLSKDEKALKALTDYINTFTGRGKMPAKSLEQAAPAMNAVLFSPRLMASRINFFAMPFKPSTYMKQSKVVRIDALKQLAKLGAAGTTLLTLAAASGADVGTDPTSTDFGKIKVGKDTRVDIFGGLQQYVVAGMRLATNQSTNIQGKTSELNTGKYGGKTRMGVIGDFMANKEAPLAALAHHLIQQEGADGRPITLPKEMEDLLMPMVIDDLWELYKQNPELIPWLAIPDIAGVGVQTMTPFPQKNYR